MFSRLAARLRAWRHRHEIRRNVDEEIAFHVDMETASRRARGLSTDEARRTALIDLGGAGRVRDEVLALRTPRLERWWSDLRQDVRYGLRAMVRAPLTAGIVVLVLATSIGLNTAVFSAVNAVFFRALDVPHPRGLIYVTSTTGRIDRDAFSARASASLANFAQTTPAQATPMSHDGLHLRLSGEWVSASYFDVLQLRPAAGRFFTAADDDPRNEARGVVISYDLWTERFERSPDVLGQQVQVGPARVTVIGVAPSGFRGVSLPWAPSQFWMTLAGRLGGLDLSVFGETQRWSSAVIARLGSGATVASVGATVAHVVDAAREPTTYDVGPATGLLTPNQKADFGFLRALAYAVLTMAFLVTIIAILNVSGILMARGVTRSTELAVRRAVGATGSRLMRQLLTESLILGVASGAAGLGVAVLLNHLYIALSPTRFALPVALDVNVLAYTTASCVIAGLLVGLAPATQARRLSIVGNLGDTGAGTPTPARRRLRYGVVVPQIMLSVTLLFVAATHAQSLIAQELRDPGFRIDDILTMTILPSSGAQGQRLDREAWARRSQAIRAQLAREIPNVPGVKGFTFGSTLPWITPRITLRPWVSRATSAHSAAVAPAAGCYTGPGFFDVFGIPILRGRDFDERDTPSSPRVAIVSTSLARQLWPDDNALGQFVAQQTPDGAAPAWLEVVGIAADTRPAIDTAAGAPIVYAAFEQNAGTFIGTLATRVSGDMTSMLGALTRTIESIDPNAELLNAGPMSQAIADDRYGPRLTLWLLGIAGALGLVLATVGLYGAVSYWVVQHMRDFGVRATLGATERDLIRLVVGDGAKVVVAVIPGLALGVLALRLTSRLMNFVVGPVSAPGFQVALLITALVGGITLVACYLPGRRAARLDPLAILRTR